MASDLGLSLRFIRAYDPEEDKHPPAWDRLSILDRAIVLALADDRDAPFEDKLSDALMFLRSRVY